MTEADKAKLSDLIELWHHEQFNRTQIALFINLLLAERKDSKQQLADARAEVERLRKIEAVAEDYVKSLSDALCSGADNYIERARVEAGSKWELCKVVEENMKAVSAKGASDDKR